MRIFLLMLLIILSTFTSCPCSAYIQPFDVLVSGQNQVLSINNPLVINQPTRVIISSPSFYSSSGACRASMIDVQSVIFSNNDIKLGEVTKLELPDTYSRFIFEWLITPGKDGIPLNGSIQARVTAKANNGKESDPYVFTVQVKAVTP